VPENGCLSFVRGSHAQSLDRDRLDEALFLRADNPANEALTAARVTLVLAPGDAVFFHCRTLHSAGSNRTSETKLSVVFTYHSAENRPLAGTRSASLPSILLQ